MEPVEMKIWKLECSRGPKTAVHYIMAPSNYTRKEVERDYLAMLPKKCGGRAACVVADSSKQTLAAVGF